MHALMIAYYTEMSLKKYINALGEGYHSSNSRMMKIVAVMKAQRKALNEGVMVSFFHSKV